MKNSTSLVTGKYKKYQNTQKHFPQFPKLQTIFWEVMGSLSRTTGTSDVQGKVELKVCLTGCFGLWIQGDMTSLNFRGHVELLVVVKQGSDKTGGLQKEDCAGSRRLSRLGAGEAGMGVREIRDMHDKGNPSLDKGTGG